MIRAVALVAAVAVAGAGVVATRVVWEGRSALAEADGARERGDAAAAIDGYRRAARWYLPGAPHVRRAYERLEAIARGAEDAGDTPTALAAWRGVRSSILATRSAYIPFADRLETANRRIAALMASQGQGGATRMTAEARRDWHMQRLERIDAPSPGWTIAALLGLAMWVAGGGLFAARGVTRDDRLAGRPAAAAAVLFAAGLVVWLASLAAA